MEKAKYTPETIANWFLAKVDRDAGDVMTHLKLQKLVYYAQAWSLALHKKPLFKEDFQAWTHGPALRTLWDKYSDYGFGALPPPDAYPEIDEADEELLEDVWENYGEHSAKYLEDLTHREGPWNKARGNLSPEAASSSKIKKENMKEFYSKLYKQLNDQ